MPVWLDAIPEKAPKVARPGTGRWLLFLAFVMLAGIALTLWCWTSERTGFVFWFTALGLPFCTWGLIFGLRRFAYKAEQVGAESRNVRKRAARTVLTGMCYSVGSATRQGSSSLTRFIGQSAMTSRT